MSRPHALARTHVTALFEEAEALQLDREAVARALLHQAVEAARQGRSIEDMAAELRFLADNLDDDEEYTFMRP